MKRNAMPAESRAADEAGARYDAGAFLDLPPEASMYSASTVVILPLPYEESVSYGGGTAGGPAAIIKASQQVELYDPGSDSEPALAFGIHTLPEPAVFSRAGASPADVMDVIAAEAARHARAGKFVVGLGGEHTVSWGMARGLAEALETFTLVHVDAHADLRDQYQDNPLSHACVVRRIAEIPGCEGILQLGIRSSSPDQAAFARSHRPKAGIRPLIKQWNAESMHDGDGWRKEFRKRVTGKQVFFSFDVDGLDPSVIPSTGTPEPNGLTWKQFMEIVRITAEHAAGVIGMDCVELAPGAGLHYADFAAARAVYAMLCRFLS